MTFDIADLKRSPKVIGDHVDHRKGHIYTILEYSISAFPSYSDYSV